ncbi:hypothetical protein GmHk_08G023269 [Glycine max]|nr:hypothetical protein GmHk_08G023269 [Glycine max]
MASRKRKSIGTRPTSQYDTRRFSSLDVWTRYTDNVLGRNILPMRKVELYHTELDDFKAELERRNFHKRLTNLADGSIDLALSRVRGHLVKIDANSLNTFLETPVVLAEGETLPAYSKYCRLPTDFREIEAALCIPDRGFILNSEGQPGKILRKDLTTLAQVWSVLSYSNLAPTSHTYNLTIDRAKLIFGLVSHLDMNIGALISGQMTSIAQSNTSRLGLPALIIALCRSRGVVSNSLTFERLSPDLTVSIRRARRARARPAELPFTSAAPTPASTSAAAFVPAQKNSQRFEAMLQSIHQGQIILLQSLQIMAPPDFIPTIEQFNDMRSLAATSEPSALVVNLPSPQPAVDPSTPLLQMPEDPTTPVLAMDTSPPTTLVL